MFYEQFLDKCVQIFSTFLFTSYQRPVMFCCGHCMCPVLSTKYAHIREQRYISDEYPITGRYRTQKAKSKI